MDLIKAQDDYYVKFEMTFEQEFPSSLQVIFTSYISHVLDEFLVWDYEIRPEVRRSSSETELLSAILDALLVDRYINPASGLLGSIGGGPTHLYITFRESLQDYPEMHASTRKELEPLIKKVVSDFLNSKVAVAT